MFHHPKTDTMKTHLKRFLIVVVGLPGFIGL